MKTFFTFIIAVTLCVAVSKSQTTALQFSGNDCNGNPVNLFADLDAGKTVILHFFMPNCGSCPPPAKKIQAMAKNINAMYPGMVKGYAFPFQNSTACTYASSWVSSSGLSELYTPMNNGAEHVANYGGFGMPTVVLLGGKDHKVLFSTLSFSTSDTTVMRDKIIQQLTASEVVELPSSVSAFSVSPNPANSTISINIDLKEASAIFVDVIDLTGTQVAAIMDENQTGIVSKQISTEAFENGIYFVRLRVNTQTSVVKLNVLH